MFTAKLLAALGGMGVGVGVLFTGTGLPTPLVSWPETTEREETIEQQKELTPLQKWLDFVVPHIKEQESEGNPYAVNWKDAEKTGHPSRGCFQYQPATFFAAVRKYDLLPNAEDAEVWNLYEDCEFQEVVTRAILTNEPSGWMHWRTTFEILKLPKTK